MSHDLPHHNLWSVEQLSAADAHGLLALAQSIRRSPAGARRLQGRHVAVLCDSDHGTSAAAVAAAAAGLGAQVAHLRPREWRLNSARELRGSMRYLGRLYAAIACDGLAAETMLELARWSAVPVCNEVAASTHPIRLLADTLTMCDLRGRPPERARLCVVGGEDSPLYGPWCRIGRLLGFGVCGCTASEAWQPAHGGDFVCDADGPICADGAPALQRRTPDGGSTILHAAEQVSNHRLMIQALLSTQIE